MLRSVKTLLAAACCMAGVVWAEADEARAKKIVSGVCFVCHGMEGESSSEAFPRLAGQHWQYTARQLEHFKSGQRKSSSMADMASRLSPDEMVALGKYFEKMPVTAEPVKDTALAAVGSYIYHVGNQYSGLPGCASCHGKDGLGTAQLPRLASQYAKYLEAQLKNFNSRERTNDNAVMHNVANKMTALEMAAVAEYLSGK